MNKNQYKWSQLLTMSLFFLFSMLLGSLGYAQVLQDLTQKDVIKLVEQMPRFPGCDDHTYPEYINLTKQQQIAINHCAQQKLLEYIYSNIRYPAKDRRKGKEGAVVAAFVVNKDGSVSEVKILKSFSKTATKEVKRVILKMNDMPEPWIPGYQDGEPVRVEFTLPTNFKLT